MDAKQGYRHVELDEESSLLTTFNTPWGKYRFPRLPFGLNVSGDVFQERLDAVLSNLSGVTNIVDDCLVRAANETEHDSHFLTLLHAARRNCIKFNSKKLQFRQPRVKFFGQNISSGGVSINDSTVEAIRRMEAPKDKATLQSYLGLVNYMKRYSQNLSKLAHPLQELVKQNTVYQWESQQQTAFDTIKDDLSKTPTLKFFNPSSNHIIQTDASLKGLGAVLLQDGQPVMYASCSLLPAEERYSNIERELLGVVFGLERMHNLIFGAKIEVQTDQQPLVSIFTKQISDVSPRLQRLLLRAHKYDVIVKYIKGSENKIADALSRVSPLSPRPADVRPEDVIPLHTLTSAMPVNQSCLEAVRTETQKDPALQQVALYVHHGWPLHKADCDPRVSPYWNSRDDVTLEDGILFRSIQMIIPKILQGKFLELLHKSHLGEEKSLLLSRTTIYWPNYTEDIRQAIRNCYACQSTRPSQPKEEIFQHEIPSGPWKLIGIDYFEWNRQKYLLLTDYYSRFPIMRSVNTMSAAYLVCVLKTIFSEYGLPEEIMSDHGSQFTSETYLAFCKEYGIKVIHSSPKYPQSNGFIESMVKITKQILERCKLTCSDAHLAMLMYRATPLQSGMASPAELLNQRRLQTVLPVKAKDSSDRGSQHRERMAAERDKRRHRFNQRAREFRELQLNENVYVQLDPEKSKWQRGNIVETPTKTQPRSYRVQLPSGQRFQRNRRHIRSDRCTEGGDEDTEDPRRTLPRRSGRDRHSPSRLHYDRLGKPTIQ
jgi:transposase InsO family protein